jgi:hypothetical protein
MAAGAKFTVVKEGVSAVPPSLFFPRCRMSSITDIAVYRSERAEKE